MSILIKGMDKPTDCGLCPFEDFGYCNVKGERNTSESGIDTDCPLIEITDRKVEPQTCDTCKWGEWYRKGYDITMMSDECGGCCSWNNKWKPKDEPQTERIKTLDYCDICNHKGCDNCIANNLDDYCVPSGYAPKDTPQTDCDTCRHYKLACELFSEICKYEPTTQTETQNSNLTFEKDECAKEYEDLGLKELKELINADRKTEPQTEKPKIRKRNDKPFRAVWLDDDHNEIGTPQTDCPWQNDEHIPTELASTMLKERFKEQK